MDVPPEETTHLPSFGTLAEVFLLAESTGTFRHSTHHQDTLLETQSEKKDPVASVIKGVLLSDIYWREI